MTHEALDGHATAPAVDPRTGQRSKSLSEVRSVQRALDILALLTEERPVVTVAEMVEQTGLAKTTVVRLVHTLEVNGLLWSTPRGLTAGPELWRWAHLAKAAWELSPEVVAMLRELALRAGETVNVYVARDVQRICVAQQQSPQPLRHVIKVGDRLPLWAGASSKVLLGGASEDLLRRVAATAPEGQDVLTRLTHDVREAEADGHAVSHGEREMGLSAVAVPICRRDGSVLAALSLSGPSVRFTQDKIPRFVADLTEVAEQTATRGIGLTTG